MAEVRLDDSSVLVRSSGVLDADIDGEIVMMSIERGEYYGLDVIGSDIWAHLEKPLAVKELCSRLLKSYEVGPEDCRRDVVAFLETLLADVSLELVDEAGDE